VSYRGEEQLPGIMALIEKDLSEPYSVYTYRYFINNWPHLCKLAILDNECVGVVVSKLDRHRHSQLMRGYIAMLAVQKALRKLRIGTRLVVETVKAMELDGCDEVVLETEITNKAAIFIYKNIGLIKYKRLYRYYMNGVDAYRLKLALHLPDN